MPADIAAAVERLRLRLLDLGGRNRLLNFRHTKKNSIRFVDEVPGDLFAALIDGVDFTIVPVPKPRGQHELLLISAEGDDDDNGDPKRRALRTAEGVAGDMGIVTSFELPDSANGANPRHEDRALQTLLFPEDLGALLRKLLSEAELAIQETGSNMLYLALGFLEWYEADSSDAARLAPLVLVPVTLERGDVDPRTREFQYTLRHNGEEPESNLSLRERLKRDFALELPELDAEAGLVAYFESVRQLCESKERWKVRTYATVALFSFGKILMYRDLSDERWPSSAKPTDHPRARELLAGVEEAPESVWAEDYDVDTPDIEALIPSTVDEADGSQLSAVVDVLKGKNLIIEGPPGTGKSQTIANIIAASLERGKSVLFVSEKLAALEVVRHRLNRVGLGDFCLELHSHKAKKLQVLEDIRERMTRRSRGLDEQRFSQMRRQFEQAKEELRRGSVLLHREVSQLGISLFDAMWQLERLRLTLGAETSDLSDIAAKLATSGEIKIPAEARRQLTVLGERLAAVGFGAEGVEAHPWFGVANQALSFLDLQRAQREVAALGEKAYELRSNAARLGEIIDELVDLPTPSSVREIVTAVSRVPLNTSAKTRRLVERILRSRATESTKKYQQALQNFKAHAKEVELLFRNPGAINIEALQELATILKRVGHLPEMAVAGELEVWAEHWKHLAADAQSAEEAFAQVEEWLSVPVQRNQEGMAFVSVCVRITETLPIAHWAERRAGLDALGAYTMLWKAAARHKAYREQQTAAEKVYDLKDLPSVAELRDLSRTAAASSWWQAFYVKQRAAKRVIRELSGGAVRPSLRVAAAELRRLVPIAEEREWWRAEQKLREMLGVSHDADDVDFDPAIALAGWYADALVGLDAFGDSGRAVLGIMWNADQRWWREARKRMEALAAALKRLDDQVEELPPTERALIAAESAGALRPLEEAAARRRDLLRSLSVACEAVGVARDLPCDRLEEARRCGDAYLVALIELGDFPAYEEARAEAGVDQETWQVVFAEAVECVSALDEAGTVGAALTRTILQQRWEVSEQVKTWSEQASDRLRQFTDQLMIVSRLLGVGDAEWFATSKGGIEQTDFLLIEAASKKASISDSLVAWIDYQRARVDAEQLGLGQLLSLVLSGRLNVSHIGAAAEFVHVSGAIRREFARSSELSQSVLQSRDSLQQQFRDLDVELQQLSRASVAFKAARRAVPGGVSSGRVGDLTERALLERECAKQRRHIPLRQLMKRAGGAIQALKPCFMMGPLSVAQYLAPGAVSFDLVIMDEASQLKTEDALGAVLRGKQLVVVGDRMQLPPTSFFDKLGEAETDIVDEEADLASGLESVLEAASAVYRPARMLRWHYRSRHVNLIAFSNQHFYQGKLIALPPTSPHDPNLGVTLIEVPEGCYSNSINVPEAQRVVREVVRLIEEHPDRSVGVVAMNATQADLISELFEKELKRSSQLRVYVERQAAGLEPFFVKNLENVQGDERDVVLVSGTYGRNEDGRVFQRFGPINGRYGHRRLNVLFTRARRRVILLASMGAEDIIVGPESGPGVRALRDYLNFARTGRLGGSLLTGRPADSDFEIAVSQALQAHGYEVSAQVGAAGYYIDLAVKSKRVPDSFLLAIECDGASYHSSRSARDRDRLRQQILEDLGWKVHRIWSTDWFRWPEHEVRRVLRILAECERSEDERLARWTPQPSAEVVSTPNQLGGVFDSPVAVIETQAIEYLTDEDVRVQLEALRDELVVARPPLESYDAFLRDEMIAALLKWRPITREEYLGRIPFDLRMDSDPQQVDLGLERVLALLGKMRRK